MKRILPLIAFLFCVSYSFAQRAETVKKVQDNEISCLCCNPFDLAKIPLYVVNEKIVPYGSVSIVDPMQIDSLTVLRQSEAGIYRDGAKNGVIVIKMRKNVQWLSVAEVLSRNGIKLTDKTLPIYFKGTPLHFDFLLVNTSKRLIIKLVDSSPIRPILSIYSGKYLSISETID